MTRSRILRPLRIAVSVVFGLLCLLLIALWVRSFWWIDSAALRLTRSEHVQARSAQGGMVIWFNHRPLHKRFVTWSQHITFPKPDKSDRIPSFDVRSWPVVTRVYTRHWFLAVVTGSAAAIAWCPRRFSLRHLLIAMTAIAVVAGTILGPDRVLLGKKRPRFHAPPPHLRLLRIAVSAVFGILCLLLIALRVRSYERAYWIERCDDDKSLRHRIKCELIYAWADERAGGHSQPRGTHTAYRRCRHHHPEQ